MKATSKLKHLVYVDVPQSPYPLSGYPPLKENVPVGSSRKRTVSEHDTHTLSKKLKLTTTQPPASTHSSNACPGYPNGYIHCHQCSHKRDVADAISCTVDLTMKSGSNATTKRACTTKFCGTCLKNRYGEDIDTFKLQGDFRCPKCRDICNCWRCRKAKGLEPLGNFVVANRKASVKPIFPSSTTDLKARKAPQPMKPRVHKEPTKTNMPPVNWTIIPTILGFEEAKSRFQIREFILRFASLMQIPASQLAELEDLGCELRSEGDQLAKWVSEACTRSIVLGLLGILVDKDDRIMEKPIRSAIQDICLSGINLTKIWAILSRLRDVIKAHAKVDENCILVSFPDPLPPPVTAMIHNTRTTRSTHDSTGIDNFLVITHSAQLVPVVEALVEAACDTNGIRETLDRSAREKKEMVRDVNDWIKLENERWDVKKNSLEVSAKTKGKIKAQPNQVNVRRELHKRQVQNMENSLKLISPGYAPRFLPLGTDNDGRTYWALSPGARERKDALDFITLTTSKSKEKKFRPKGRPLDQEARSAMKEWSWCIVVWGTAPVGSTIRYLRDNKEPEMGENAEQWWGFCDPQEIRKVATWADRDIDERDGLLSSLAKRLKEYASLLEWRLREDKYELVEVESQQ